MFTSSNCNVKDGMEEAYILRLQQEFIKYRESYEYKKAFYVASPLVTVCISTSDRSDLLIERAVKSVISQTYKNMQVIIIGDQCEDNTCERIASLNDERLTFENLPIRGPYPPPGLHRWMVAGTNPANRALEMASGEFITHIDEDDTCEPDRIAVLVSELQKTKVDLVFHPFWWENDDGNWFVLGNGMFDRGEISTGTVLYHSWFKKVLADVYAYRKNEPGDWNRFKKMIAIGASVIFFDRPLSSHHKYPVRDLFTPKENEEFI